MVAGVWVGARARRAVRVDRPTAVRVVNTEVQVRPSRSAGHPRDAEHLPSGYGLALGDRDARHVAVKANQAISVVDLDSQTGKTRVAAGHQPAGEDDAARRRRRDRLVVEAVVVAVVTRVVEVV